MSEEGQDRFDRTHPEQIISPNDSAKQGTNELPGTDLDSLQDLELRSRVLIIDDDPEAVTLLKLTLRSSGFDVTGAHSAEQAIEKCSQFNPDIILLDLMMPRVDGWVTFRRLRKLTDAPVVIVSALGEKTDIVQGLNTGADDYVSKPFYPPEIVSRIRAVLRRAKTSQPVTARLFPDVRLWIDFETKEVNLGTQSIMLTPKEFSVLEVLGREAPRPVSYEQLAEDIWGLDTKKAQNRLKWTIHNLRIKLKDNPLGEDLIRNRTGFGYQLNMKP